MRIIRKNQPPTSLIDYKKKVGASYDDRDKNVNDDLRLSLFQEQLGICAYCQQKLKFENFTIEHHCERTICNGADGTIDKRLDYKNLFAVCQGQGGMPSETHCDTKKAEKAQKPALNGLPMNLIPTNSSHINSIKYSSNGRMSSSNHVYDTELNNLLNLNAKHLKEMRKRKWLQIFSYSKNKNGYGTNTLKMRRLIQKDLTTKDGLFSNSFPALSEYMENKFC